MTEQGSLGLLVVGRGEEGELQPPFIASGAAARPTHHPMDVAQAASVEPANGEACRSSALFGSGWGLRPAPWTTAAGASIRSRQMRTAGGEGGHDVFGSEKW